MTAAILAAAEKRSISGAGALIVRTQQINRLLGTSLAPWELEELPAWWMEALENWLDGMPKAQAWRNEVEAAMKRLKAKNARLH